MASLDNVYNDYCSGKVQWDHFIASCYEYIQHRTAKFLPIAPDDRDDTVAEFYPRLCTLAERYENTGSSFETYVTVSLRYYWRTRTRKRDARREYEVLIPDFQTMECTAESADYTVTESKHDAAEALERSLCPLLSNTRTRDAIRRQLIISFCKNFPLLSESEIQRYIARLRIPLSFVRSLDSFVTERRSRVIKRRNEFARLRDRHFVRMQSFQRRADTEIDVKRRRQWEEQRAFHRRRWSFYRRRLQRQYVHLSNKEVAELLGIPKGSVDSALARLAHRLELINSRRYAVAHEQNDTGIE